MSDKKDTTTKTNNKKKSPQKNKNAKGKRLLIDAFQSEETRVAVVENGRLEDFEIESLVRKQIKGNIYLAKVTRVEPSLQAAFVNYGGNRHGFLPFSEIHPDYYQIPVADRERLMAEQKELEEKAAAEAAAREAEEDALAEQEKNNAQSKSNEENIIEIDDEDSPIIEAGADAQSDDADDSDDEPNDDDITVSSDDADDDSEKNHENDESESDDETAADSDPEKSESDDQAKDNKGRRRGRGRYRRSGGKKRYASSRDGKSKNDSVYDDDDETNGVEPFWKRIRRAYKIQEVIKRGQIMLIQVTKEERGNKGAAVTSYITLPGRYCVLMPNSPQSGGVSRKIANYTDRKRMREILKDLSVPSGMSVILRTAGTARTKVEIKRDMDYLMRLWNSIRDLTLQSTAPALINEESNLIHRAIRDTYNKDITEVVIAGDEGYKAARDMMKMLMPSHVRKVKQYKGETPLFITEALENQIEDIHSPVVHLKSGGYLVINPTEALVSVDVNSGRATRERNIEDTALATNLEAAQEVARQLRLRDLGGLVVIDFIDMDTRRFNGRVEKALRNALSGDKARIQMGRISSFGLMELSRQRMNPSLTETHFETCPKCRGTGVVKTVDTAALAIMRAIEETGLQNPQSDVSVLAAQDVILYLMNQKRAAIAILEDRYNLSITLDIGTAESEKDFDLTYQKRKIKREETPETDADDVTTDEVTESEDTEKTEKSDDKPKSRRGRGSRGGKGKAKKIDIVASDNVEDTAKADEPPVTAETDAAEETVSEPQKKPRRGRKKKTDDTTAKESKETSESVDDTNEQPSNDNGGAAQEESDEPVAKDYETVNEAPKKKKKGWWNKLVD